MKKILLAVLAIVLMLSLCACRAAYRVKLVDDAGLPVGNVRVIFCDDASCSSALTGEDGIAAAPSGMKPGKITLGTLPEGYNAPGDEFTVGSEDMLIVTLEKVQ